MLNINYNCYSLVQSKKLLVQTQLLISLQAQGILGSCAGGRKHHGSPSRANGGEGGVPWVHQVRVAGLIPRGTLCRGQACLFRVPGDESQGSVGTARLEQCLPHTSALPALEHLCLIVIVTSHRVGTTASASITQTNSQQHQVKGLFRPALPHSKCHCSSGE